MKCPQCSTELPDSAIFCVQCGSSIRQASFSYLPVGAPAWPTEQLQVPQYRNAPSESAQYIAPLEASSKVSSGSATSKKSRLGISAIIGLCILSILIGGGLTFGILYINGQRLAIGPQPTLKPLQLPTPSASSTPASSTPTAFQTYNSADLGITMQFPSDWVMDPAQKSADSAYFGIHPQQQQTGIYLAFERYTTSGSAKVSSTSAINQFNFSQFQNQQSISNFQIITSLTPKRTIGGVQWDEQDATFTNPNNVLFHLTTVAVQYKKLYYDIFFYSPASTYDTTLQNYITPILNSVKFD